MGIELHVTLGKTKYKVLDLNDSAVRMFKSFYKYNV